MLGSLSLLLNPTGLLAGVASSLRDILNAPVQGLAEGSAATVVAGVGQGSLSLIRHLASWSLTSVAGFSTAFATQLQAALAYKEPSLVAPPTPPTASTSSLASTLGAGLYGLYKGLEGGVAGMFAYPYAGIRYGSVGFVTGIGRGLLGAVGLPISGVLDLVGHVLNGVASTTGVVDIPARMERPLLPLFGGAMVQPSVEGLVASARAIVSASGVADEGDRGALVQGELLRLLGLLARWPVSTVCVAEVAALEASLEFEDQGGALQKGMGWVEGV